MNKLISDRILDLSGVGKQILTEAVFGKLATIYHRTGGKSDITDKISDIGFIAGSGAMYKKGIYATYDLKSQLRPRMSAVYGPTIVKAKVNLQNFLIFDYKVAKKVYGDNYTLVDQIKTIQKMINKNIKIPEGVKEISDSLKQEPYITSDFAQRLVGGYDEILRLGKGIVFTGHNDGRVVVTYDRNIVIPFVYNTTKRNSQKLDSSTWKKFEPGKVKELIKKGLDSVHNYLYFSMVEETIKVLSINDEKFKEIIETFNKKGRKKGIELTYNLIEEVEDKEASEKVGKPVKKLTYLVSIPIQVVKIPGYEYLGFKAKSKTTDAFTIVPFEDIREENIKDLEENFKTEKCDVCKQKRKRNLYFYFKHSKTKKVICMGSSCVEKYLGVDVVKELSSVTQNLAKIREEITSDKYSTITEERLQELKAEAESFRDMVSASLHIIKKDGGYIKGNPGFDDYGGYIPDPNSTKEKVKEALDKNDYNKIEDEEYTKIIDFAKGLKADISNTFILNVKKHFEEEVKKPSVGIVAAGVGLYYKESKKEGLPKSDFVGSEGERVEKELKLISDESKVSSRGNSYRLITFLDNDGNIYKLFDFKRTSFEDKALYNFIIKQHNEFRGEKTNVIDKIEKGSIKEFVPDTGAFVGNPGDKLSDNLTLTDRTSRETQYGTMNIYTFKDDNRNVYKWLTSKYIELGIGQKINASFKVKSHDTYQDENYTKITHLKILSKNESFERILDLAGVLNE